MNLIINSKNKKIFLEVHRCNWLEMLIGLMFSRREKAKALLFEFKTPVKISIHSFFVFFPFLAIWINSEGKILEKRIISPWKLKILPKKEFSKLIEIPISRRYSEKIKQLFS